MKPTLFNQRIVLKIAFCFLFLTGMLSVGNAQAAIVYLTTCASVTNLNGLANVSYVISAPISCTGPIVINIPSTSTLSFDSQGSLNSPVSVSINSIPVTSNSTGTSGGIIGIVSNPITGTITSTTSGPVTLPVTTTITGSGTIVLPPGPVNAKLYVFDYDTGGAIRPFTRNIGMVVGIESKQYDSSYTFNSLVISSYTATDFKGYNVNLMLPSSLTLKTPFDGTAYGEQKNVFGPFSVRPLREDIIDGGLVIDIVIPWGSTNLHLSTTAAINQNN